MNNKKISKRQMNEMLRFIEGHPQMIPDYQNSPSSQSRQHLNMLWEKLTDKLNSMGVPNKSVAEWRRTWTTHKYRTKRKLSNNRLSFEKKEEESNEELPLTSEEEGIVERTNFELAIACDEDVGSFDAPVIILDEDTLPSTSQAVRSPSVIDFTATDDIPANAIGKRKNSSQYNPAKRRAEAAKLDKLYKKREQQENQKYRERKLQLQQQSLECQQQTLQCLQQLLRTMKERDERTESFHDCVLETIGTAVFQPHLQKHNDTSDEDKVPLQ